MAVGWPQPPGGGVQPKLRHSIAHKIGLGALCLHLFAYAGFVNESLELFAGLKPYITLIAGPVVALSLFASGSLFRGLRTKTGVLWAGMLMMMLIGVPFSVWKSDSLREWLSYASRVHPIFFFICAAAFTVVHCRRLFYANILGGVFVLALTVVFSKTHAGRLVIPRLFFQSQCLSPALAHLCLFIILLLDLSREFRPAFGRISGRRGRSDLDFRIKFARRVRKPSLFPPSRYV